MIARRMNTVVSMAESLAPKASIPPGVIRRFRTNPFKWKPNSEKTAWSTIRTKLIMAEETIVTQYIAVFFFFDIDLFFLYSKKQVDFVSIIAGKR